MRACPVEHLRAVGKGLTLEFVAPAVPLLACPATALRYRPTGFQMVCGCPCSGVMGCWRRALTIHALDRLPCNTAAGSPDPSPDRYRRNSAAVAHRGACQHTCAQSGKSQVASDTFLGPRSAFPELLALHLHQLAGLSSPNMARYRRTCRRRPGRGRLCFPAQQQAGTGSGQFELDVHQHTPQTGTMARRRLRPGTTSSCDCLQCCRSIRC